MALPHGVIAIDVIVRRIGIGQDNPDHEHNYRRDENRTQKQRRPHPEDSIFVSFSHVSNSRGSTPSHLGRDQDHNDYEHNAQRGLRLEQRMPSEQAQAAQLNEEAAQQEEMNLSSWLYDPMW
jgi:hypothetical protein